MTVRQPRYLGLRTAQDLFGRWVAAQSRNISIRQVVTLVALLSLMANMLPVALLASAGGLARWWMENARSSSSRLQSMLRRSWREESTSSTKPSLTWERSAPARLSSMGDIQL